MNNGEENENFNFSGVVRAGPQIIQGEVNHARNSENSIVYRCAKNLYKITLFLIILFFFISVLNHIILSKNNLSSFANLYSENYNYYVNLGEDYLERYFDELDRLT